MIHILFLQAVKVEAYYLPGTYDYTLKLAKHKALTGKVTVAKSGETSSVYKFENIASDVNKATLVHAYYKADKTLDSVTTTDVDIQNGTYTVKPVEKTGCTEKYMLLGFYSRNETCFNCKIGNYGSY